MSAGIARIDEALAQAKNHRDVKALVESLAQESEGDASELLSSLQGKNLAQAKALARATIIASMQEKLAELQAQGEDA